MSDYELFVEILKARSPEVRSNFISELFAPFENDYRPTDEVGHYLEDGDPLKDGTLDCLEALLSLAQKAVTEAGGTE